MVYGQSDFPPGDGKEYAEWTKTRQWGAKNKARQQKEEDEAERRRKSEQKEHNRRMRDARPRSDASVFQHSPLPNPQTQIRLMEIDVEGETLVSLLRDFDLNTAPSFVAVSYTWGPPEESSFIWINGKQFKVGANCWSALHCLVMLKVAFIWIDAICINQRNNVEKAQQVQMMTDIFARASWVAAIPQNPVHERLYDSQIKPFLPQPGIYDEALAALAEDPFFSRLWIVQEVLVAKQVRLISLLAHITFDDLEYYVRGSRLTSPAFSRMKRLVEDRRNIQSSQRSNSSVFRSLSKYSELDCRDPRDRLYALVPMALLNTHLPRLKPSYEKPLFNVLLEFAEYVCRLPIGQHLEQEASVSDFLICLMKLARSFSLDSQDEHLSLFLKERSLVLEDGKTQLNFGKGNEAIYWVSRHSQTVCLNQSGMTLLSSTALTLDGKQSLEKMGFACAEIENDSLVIICNDGEPAYVASAGITSRDILLPLWFGSLGTTWNLILRESQHQSGLHHLVSQAFPFRGVGQSFKKHQSCMCGGRCSPMTLYMHAHDVVILALLARDPVQRLANPVTTSKCGSHAIHGR